MAFSDKAVRSAEDFVVQNVDCWIEVLLRGNDGSGWTEAIDISDKASDLAFDIMGDLSFGKSFNLKEPGPNPVREIPKVIGEFMDFGYPVCQSCSTFLQS